MPDFTTDVVVRNVEIDNNKLNPDKRERLERLNRSIDMLQEQSIGRYDPEYFIESATRYLVKRYNLSELAIEFGESFDKHSLKYQELRSAFSEIIGIEMLLNEHEKKQFEIKTIKQISSEESTKKYGERVASIDAVDFLIDEMYNEDPSGYIFDRIDRKTLVEKFNKIKDESLKRKAIEVEYRKKAIDRAILRVGNTLRILSEIKKVHRLDFFGLGKNSIVTKSIVFSKLLSDGYSIPDIFLNSPEMAENRLDASRDVQIRKKIAGDLYVYSLLKEGISNVLDFIKKSTDGLELFAPQNAFEMENEYLILIFSFLDDFKKDFLVMLNAFRDTEKLKDENKEILDLLEFYSQVYKNITSGISGIGNELIRLNKLMTDDINIILMSYRNALNASVTSAYLDYIKADNSSRPLALSLSNEDTMDMKEAVLNKLLLESKADEIRDRIIEDISFREKAVTALFDATFNENLRLKINKIEDNPDEGEIKIDYTVDFNKAIEMIDFRNLSFAREYNAQKAGQKR